MEAITTNTQGDSIVINVEKKCMSWKSSVRCSPPPKYQALLKGVAVENGGHKIGTALNIVVREYFDSLPQERRMQLIERSKNHY